MNREKALPGDPFLVAGSPPLALRESTAAPAAPGHEEKTFAAIDAYVESERRRLKLPAVSLAIVAGDEIVHTRGFGRAFRDGRPPSPRTKFYIGSITKSITALGIMQLVEAGKIALDSPVARYLPWFRVADPQASASMSVRHLLYQTSGLPDLLGEMALAEFDLRPGAAERHGRALATAELAHPVGTAWEYSNSNYILLGLIIEAASGDTYTSYLRKRILDPLGMDDTYAPEGMGEDSEMATGHQLLFGHPFKAGSKPIPPGALAGGGLVSTAADLARYMIALLNGGRLGDTQILSGNGIAALQRQAILTRQMNIPFGYGMGWFTSDLGDTKLVWHGGNVPHYAAYLGLLPAQKKGIVLLTNASHHWMTPILGESGSGAAALLAGQSPVPLFPVRLMPWALRAQPVIPALQMAGIALMLRRLRRQQRRPLSRPFTRPARGRHRLFSLAPNLLLARLLLPIMGNRRAYLRQFMPDTLWLAYLCGGLSLISILLRTLRPIFAWVGSSGPDTAVRPPEA